MVKNLRKLRISKGISQQQLAEVIGTSQQSINKYENHNVEPDISTLSKLADYFDVTIDYLVGHISCDKVEEQIDLSDEESIIIENYRELSKEEQQSIRMILKNYLNNKETHK